MGVYCVSVYIFFFWFIYIYIHIHIMYTYTLIQRSYCMTMCIMWYIYIYITNQTWRQWHNPQIGTEAIINETERSTPPTKTHQASKQCQKWWEYGPIATYIQPSLVGPIISPIIPSAPQQKRRFFQPILAGQYPPYDSPQKPYFPQGFTHIFGTIGWSVSD